MLFLAINGAALVGCAVFFSAENNATMLVALMLFLPFLDRGFRHTLGQPLYRRETSVPFVVLFLLYSAIFPDRVWGVLLLVVFTAMPEEWFFRRYFLTQLQRTGLAGGWCNLITSVLFAVAHLPSQGIWGLSVFFPSLLLGAVYQKTTDLFAVISLHVLFNLFYSIVVENVI